MRVIVRRTFASLSDRLTLDLTTAMRAKDVGRTETIRSLRSRLTYKLKEKGAPDELPDAVVLGVVQKAVAETEKTLEELATIDSPRAEELRETARQERAILLSYLPEPVSEQQVQSWIDEAVASVGASSVKQMGAVMEIMSKRISGRFDPKQLSKMVKQTLTKD